MRSLAAVEARRLLLHPLVLGSTALCLLLWTYRTSIAGTVALPVLHDQDRFLQTQLLLPAAGVFLASHLAVLRSTRDETEPWFALMVLPRWRRAAAHLLAVLPVVVLTALLASVRIAWLALLPGAVGTPSAAELATGPAVVLLAGALAVLVGTLFRSGAAGPLVLGLLAVLTVVGGIADSQSWRWLLPVAHEDDMRTALPAHLLDRPAALHLGYLVLLAAICASGTLLRAGLRATSVRAGAVLALSGAIALGAVQLQHPRDGAAQERALYTPSEQQRCDEERGVRYCAFPDFADRRAQWAPVVHGILDALPEGVGDEPYVVRQRITPITGPVVMIETFRLLRTWREDDRRAGTAGAVVVGTHWGDHDDLSTSATAGFAAEFAHRAVVGDDADPGPAADDEISRVCGSRAVLSVWLAGQATPATGRALSSVLRRSGGDFVGFASVMSTAQFGRAEADLGMALLDRPRDTVARTVHASWRELASPTTTAARAAELLGVPAPPRPTRECAR
ncbi:ABC transporter permease [Streptomyces sp. NPDC014894]|uniref:ABC transporter permease n=1 Tax=Streptomyces sp. NPDC014894 TaxID=3364931 RepID=UPI0036F6A6DC